jgi:hypothetical protein
MMGKQTVFRVIMLVPWMVHIMAKYWRLSSRRAECIGQAKKVKGIRGWLSLSRVAILFLLFHPFRFFCILFIRLLRASPKAQAIQEEVAND